MALKLEILLTAVDRLSAPLEAARLRLAALTGPVTALAGATQRLGRAAGVDALAGALGRVGGAARDAAGAVAQVATRAGLLAGAARAT